MIEQDESQRLFKALVNRAQYLLAMREHGAKELKAKLEQKFPEAQSQPGLVEKAVEFCQQQNWQSDARYIESYVRQAIDKGQGALKIRQALMRSCDDTLLIADALALGDDVWIEVARALLDKKYGETAKPAEPKEQARRLRFLQSRGFSASQCYKAFC